MLTRLPAADALALVHAELGEPPITVLDANAGPRALRGAVAEAAARPGGALLALFAPDASALTLPRTWLATGNGPRVELHTMPVAEGVLLLAHVRGRRGPASSPSRTPSPASTGPDSAPVVSATPDDLDDDVIRRLLRGGLEGPERVPTTGTNEERYLARFGLLVHDGERFRPTVAAVLVAGRRPALHLPGCALVGEVDDERFALGGTVPTIVRAVGQGCLGDADRDLLAEVVLNALLHRDWSNEEPVRLVLAGERLEVSAPARLLAGAPRRAAHTNPLLVRFACALDLAHGDGRGLRDIARRLSEQRRPSFSLVERDGRVAFVAELRRRAKPRPQRPPPTSRHLPPPPKMPVPPTPPEREAVAPPPAAHPPEPPPPTTPAPVAPVPALLPREPDDRADVLLTVLRDRGGATTRELAVALGCSRPVIGKALAVLVEDGRVQREAASSRSPFQRYVCVG